ncbi:iron(III) transport system ATP-binding protein [Symbiobacterium terraclitae]|uniref:Iron(III) transport system ATP-binding protein n=1 Tax=Symbiobacterium terraclitae TaxID=557451 RepID=A0ABS4JVW2_9FIRM|nr:ABC transporter ATP-binding protein [Symbiobacterium terraclitae]MBP2019675.1 iron(III) transport system ATP-binding protein [Symbiobacterium terraclitae]
MGGLRTNDQVGSAQPVTLEHVSKSFGGGVLTVRDVNLTIGGGEFFTLLGPSGCGKTTTLRMIAGFYYPTSGRILFGDRDVTYVPPNDRNIGMVFQNYALFPHMTVFENVAFGLRVRKVAGEEIRRRVAEALAQVRLEGMEQRRIDQLSGGQQQRVALARALVIRPALLLLDEPLSNLDAKLRDETRTEIRRLQTESSITAVYVTHDQAEAMAISDRIAVMEGGVVHQVGSPQDIYHRPATRFVATFIGKSNLLEGKLVAADGGTGTVELPGSGRIQVDLSRRNPQVSTAVGSPVVLTVRPEGMQVVPEPGGPNVLSGRVLAAEFSGAYTEYVVAAGEARLIASVADRYGEVRRQGDPIHLYIPPERVYLVE